MTSNRMPLYFFINGLLHRKLHINRGKDEITTWCYPLHKRVTYSYTDTKRRLQTAFTTTEVCSMINRSLRTVEGAIIEGKIKEPQSTYGLNERKRKFKYLWREEDIVGLHNYLISVHQGRPRKDGLVSNLPLPTLRELRAMINQEQILYVKVGDEFVPTFKAHDI